MYNIYFTCIYFVFNREFANTTNPKTFMLINIEIFIHLHKITGIYMILKEQIQDLVNRQKALRRHL
jgi:hypothetical protein